MNETLKKLSQKMKRQKNTLTQKQSVTNICALLQHTKGVILYYEKCGIFDARIENCDL